MAKFVINPKSSSQKDVPLNANAVSIGRDPANDLVLSDSMVSRRHAMLELREDTYFLRDNNSSNGTFVNGDRLAEEVRLRDGDLVAIGSSKLLFHGGDDAAVPGYAPEAGGVLPTTGLDRGMLPPTAPLAMESPNPSPTTGRCATCAAPFTPGDRFCRKCGKPLSPEAPAAPASASPPPVPPIPSKRVAPRPAASPAGADSEVAPIPTYIAPRPVGGRRAAPEPAGFGIRLVAYLVDSIILFIPFLLVNLVLGAFLLNTSTDASPQVGAAAIAMLVYGVLAFVSAAYLVLFWGLRGATPGKSLLGLEVRTEDGQSPIGISRAIIRCLGYALSGSLFGLGFLWIAFNEDKRGWHDRIAKTIVVRQG